MIDSLAKAKNDIVGGLMRWQLWSLLGWYDLRRRYRRSVFGPLWTTFSIAIFVAALGTLYAKLFNRSPEIYIPHLTLGFLAWTFFANTISGSCGAFVSAERYIKEMSVPLSTFIYRIIYQNVIIFLYQSLVYVAVAFVFGIMPGFYVFLAVLGFGLILINAVWVGLLMGVLAARYRDIPEIVSNIMRIAFFLTPILWTPDMVGRRTELLDLNPFYHFIELLRAPLLGNAPQALAWWVALGFALVGWVAALLIFARLRNQIVYWL